MVTEVYSHILDEDRRKNAQLIEAAFYNKKNIKTDMKGQMGESKDNENTGKISIILSMQGKACLNLRQIFCSFTKIDILPMKYYLEDFYKYL